MIIFRQPFKGDYPITQEYGVVIPGVTYNNKPHTGIDYGCPEGTDVYASADGVVKYAEFDKTGFGNTIIIRHNNGKATLYAHLSKIFAYVGQTVKQGNAIGLSGSTGNTTGPHLHFEARAQWNDWRSHFDPMDLPLMNFSDASAGDPEQLKGADSFQPGDLMKVSAPLGVKAFFNSSFEDYTVYPMNSNFYFTGDSVVRKDNGLTYMRMVPVSFSVWMAVNDGETQILDKVGSW